MIGGDFNTICFPNEKSSSVQTMRTMREFNNFIRDIDIRDSPLLNSRFTWIYGCQSPIMCQLDRFLVSMDWEEMFPHFYQEAHGRLVSDH